MEEAPRGRAQDGQENAAQGQNFRFSIKAAIVTVLVAVAARSLWNFSTLFQRNMHLSLVPTDLPLPNPESLDMLAAEVDDLDPEEKQSFSPEEEYLQKKNKVESVWENLKLNGSSQQLSDFRKSYDDYLSAFASMPREYQKQHGQTLLENALKFCISSPINRDETFKKEVMSLATQLMSDDQIVQFLDKLTSQAASNRTQLFEKIHTSSPDSTPTLLNAAQAAFDLNNFCHLYPCEIFESFQEALKENENFLDSFTHNPRDIELAWEKLTSTSDFSSQQLSDFKKSYDDYLSAFASMPIKYRERYSQTLLENALKFCTLPPINGDKKLKQEMMSSTTQLMSDDQIGQFLRKLIYEASSTRSQFFKKVHNDPVDLQTALLTTVEAAFNLDNFCQLYSCERLELFREVLQPNVNFKDAFIREGLIKSLQKYGFNPTKQQASNTVMLKSIWDFLSGLNHALKGAYLMEAAFTDYDGAEILALMKRDNGETEGDLAEEPRSRLSINEATTILDAIVIPSFKTPTLFCDINNLFDIYFMARKDQEIHSEEIDYHHSMNQLKSAWKELASKSRLSEEMGRALIKHYENCLKSFHSMPEKYHQQSGLIMLELGLKLFNIFEYTLRTDRKEIGEETMSLTAHLINDDQISQLMSDLISMTSFTRLEFLKKLKDQDRFPFLMSKITLKWAYELDNLRQLYSPKQLASLDPSLQQALQTNTDFLDAVDKERGKISYPTFSKLELPQDNWLNILEFWEGKLNSNAAAMPNEAASPKPSTQLPDFLFREQRREALANTRNTAEENQPPAADNTNQVAYGMG